MQSKLEKVNDNSKIEFTNIGEAFTNIFKHFDELHFHVE